MIEALIFDMDGTMIDSMPTHARSWQVFAQRHGLAIELADLLRRTTGRTGVECMREIFPRKLGDDEALTLALEKEVIYRELFAPVFAEVAGFSKFAALAAKMGLKIGVATAGDRHNIAFAFEHLRMHPPPDAVVGGDEGLPGKPEPALFLEAARRLGVAPARCIVLEDAPFGIEAARRAGMRAIAIGTSHGAAELDGPHVLTHVRDYLELMKTGILEKLHAEIA
ncbi:MAG: HAD family phosphatase [Burkholderiaceae bacterium]|nr:HAD family phosphatase [Burkholderiaceae bacterium]